MIDITIGISVFMIGVIIGVYIVKNIYTPMDTPVFSTGIITATPKGDL